MRSSSHLKLKTEEEDFNILLNKLNKNDKNLSSVFYHVRDFIHADITETQT